MSSEPTSTEVHVRSVALARGAWGLALLCRPAVVLRPFGSAGSGWRVRAVARALGARHLVQAGLTLSPGSRWPRRGVAVDAAHAASMLLLATRLHGPSRRLPAASAVVATGWALLGYRAATTDGDEPPQR